MKKYIHLSELCNQQFFTDCFRIRARVITTTNQNHFNIHKKSKRTKIKNKQGDWLREWLKFFPEQELKLM